VYFVIPLLYGEAYQAAGSLFLVLVVAATMQSSLTAYGAAAMVRQQRRRLPAAQALAVVLDLGLAALLIPLVGVAGAAVGAAAGLVAVNAGLLLREEGFQHGLAVILCGPWLKSVAAGCLGLTAASTVGSPIVAGALASIVALAVHVLLLWRFHRDEIKGIIALAAPHLPRRLAACTRQNLTARTDDT